MQYQQLKQNLLDLNQTLLKRTVQAINFHLTLRNWLIGRYIVEYEQHGMDRAVYGDQLLKRLAEDLQQSKLKGVSERNLFKMRAFFITYEISPTLSAKLPFSLTAEQMLQKSIELSRLGTQEQAFQDFIFLCTNLTWSHFVELIRLDKAEERQFYEREAIAQSWSIREMKRQIDSQLFFRMQVSQNKAQVTRSEATPPTPQELIKDPYVFEFLDLPEQGIFSESELEQAIINKLHDFLLEMGTGFCFVARQKRLTFDTKHYAIDLLLFNRKLKSLVAIDLKIGVFDHTDVGQMNFYLNYLNKNEREVDENPAIGIILCSSKNDAIVEYALGGLDNQIFVSKYQHYLPSPQALKKLVIDTQHSTQCQSQADIPLEQIGFPNKILKILKQAGIDMLNALINKDQQALLNLKGIGPVSLKLIVEKLKQQGFALLEQVIR